MKQITLHLICFTLLLTLLPHFIFAQTKPETPNQQSVTKLELGKPVERELRGGEVHPYSIQLTTEQFCNVIVEQRGIDVVVSLFAPDEKQLAEIDSPNGAEGPEPVFWISPVAGTYRLEVRSLDKDVVGKYEIRIEALRDATARDKNFIAARKVLDEAAQLLAQKTEAATYQAIEKFKEALPLLRAGNDRYQEARTLNRIGVNYFNLSELEKALEYWNQALPIWRTFNERVYEEATTLRSIGIVYAQVGELKTALDYYKQALDRSKTGGSAYSEADALYEMATVYEKLGDNSKALEYRQQVLSIFRSLKYREAESETIFAIGRSYFSLKDYRKALEYFNQSLDALTEEVGVNDARIGVAQTALGRTYSKLGEKQKALDLLGRALTFVRQTGDYNAQVDILYHLAGVEYDSKNPGEARRRIEEALSIVESQRAKISSQSLRSSYFASVQDIYEFYTFLLMKLHKQQPSAGYDSAALSNNEKARARSLLDTLNEAKANIRQSVPAPLLERERVIQQQLNDKALQQSKLLINNQPEPAAALNKEIDRLTLDYQNVQTQIRQASPRYAALTRPEPLKLSEIQRDLLDADTVVLEYALGEESSYLWVITKTSLNSYELPNRARIEPVARRVYELLSDGKQWAQSANINTQYAEAAGQLSEMLLSQVSGQIKGKRLVVVSDGVLQYIPFSALPVPQTAQNTKQKTVFEPLAVGNEIVSLPSASTLAVLRRETANRKPASKSVAVFADPVFTETDERLAAAKANQTKTNGKSITNPGSSRSLLERAFNLGDESNEALPISRLPFTRREAESILESALKGSSMKALDFTANRETALSRDLSNFRYVHFATHGLLNSEHPELSGIVLSLVNEQGKAVNGFLRLNEIYNLNLSADLVVLSACQTALGKEVRGEGLIGLTRGFMYAGSPRVVASLWKVDDVATAELMKIFYQKMLKEKMRPAAALRAAKVEMWKQKRWNAPFYWAAFEIQGEWR